MFSEGLKTTMIKVTAQLPCVSKTDPLNKKHKGIQPHVSKTCVLQKPVFFSDTLKCYL